MPDTFFLFTFKLHFLAMQLRLVDECLQRHTTRINAPLKESGRVTFRAVILKFNSLPASGEFCSLLTIFANSLDPNQARQNVGPDLDPNRLTL